MAHTPPIAEPVRPELPDPRLQLALDAARIGTFVWDPVADRTDPDEQVPALLDGQKPTDLSLGALLEHVVHPGDRRPLAEAIAAGLDPAGPGCLDRVVRLRPTGGPVTHVRVTWRAEFADAGAARHAVRVFGAVVDVSEHERAREELRRAAELDAFRVALTDALRATDQPEAMQRAAIELLRDRLGAARTAVVQIDHEALAATILAQACAGVTPLGGPYPLDGFGPQLTDAVRAGRPFVVEDIHAVVDDEGQRAAFAALGVRAVAMTRPVRDGDGATYVAVHHVGSHEWAEHELALAEEVAERLRTAVQRARAEAALRETGSRLQVAQDAAQMAFVTWDAATDRTDYDERAVALLGELTGPSLREALSRSVHPDDRDRLLAAIRAATDPRSNGRYHEVVRVERPGAPRAWVAVTGQVRFAGHGAARRAVRAVATLIDITERVLAEHALQQANEHDRFLLALGDALRPLGDPAAVQRAAARVLANQLGASRAFYAEVTDERWGRIREEHRAGVPSVAGRHRLAEFGQWIVDDLRADETVVIEDVLSDPRMSPGGAKAFLDRSVRAMVAVPLVKDDRLVALLGVHQAAPRTWRAQDVALAEATAEHTWSAVERARSQVALQARMRPRRRG